MTEGAVTSGNPIRVLVVDDSPLVRRTIEKLLDADPGVKIVGIAAAGRSQGPGVRHA